LEIIENILLLRRDNIRVLLFARYIRDRFMELVKKMENLINKYKEIIRILKMNECIKRLESIKTNSEEEESIKKDFINKIKNYDYAIEIKFSTNNLDFVEKIEKTLENMIKLLYIDIGDDEKIIKAYEI
jgi:hypothetical protein